LERDSMLGIIGWIVFGLIVGVLAKLLMPGRDPGGMLVTIELGIAGALVAGFLGRTLGWYQPARRLASSWRRWVPCCCCSFTADSRHARREDHRSPSEPWYRPLESSERELERRGRWLRERQLLSRCPGGRRAAA